MRATAYCTDKAIQQSQQGSALPQESFKRHTSGIVYAGTLHFASVAGARQQNAFSIYQTTTRAGVSPTGLFQEEEPYGHCVTAVAASAFQKAVNSHPPISRLHMQAAVTLHIRHLQILD